MNEPMDKQTGEDDAFARKAKALFDESVESLDGASLSRLNRGRHEALETLSTSGLKGRWSMWVPAGGVAAAALVAVLVMRAPGIGEVPAAITVTDFEILMDADNIELVDDFALIEDLEFYSWLEASELGANGDLG